MARRSTAPISRILGVLVAVVMSSLTLVAIGSAPAAAGTAAEDTILNAVNDARVTHGLRPLAVSHHLESIARDWSQHMAAGRCSDGWVICHNGNLGAQVSGWQGIGENVGVGPDAMAIHQALMDSPDHRANLLNPSYTLVGIGTATGEDGRLYVTQDFEQPFNDSHAGRTASAPAKTPVHIKFHAGSHKKNRVKLGAFMRAKHQGAKVKFFRVKKNGDRVKYGVDRANRRGNAYLRHRFDHASGKTFRFVSVVVPVKDRHKKTRSDRDWANID